MKKFNKVYKESLSFKSVDVPDHDVPMPKGGHIPNAKKSKIIKTEEEWRKSRAEELQKFRKTASKEIKQWRKDNKSTEKGPKR
jgi:hypothetical protein